MKGKKGQLGAQYFMSYGWILVFAALITAVFYATGSLDLKNFIPEECTLGYATPCIDFEATNESILLILGNNVNQLINVISLTADQCGDTSSGEIQANQRTVFIISNCTITDSRYEGKIVIVYQKGSLTYNNKGSLTARVHTAHDAP